jgi:hypothetical protein
MMCLALLAASTATCASGDIGTTPLRIPFHLDSRSNLPTVTASISGKPVSLLLDLGGYHAIALKPAVAQALSVDFGGGNKTLGDSSGAERTSRDFTASKLVVGDLALGHMEGGELRGHDNLPQDGYLGLGLLQGYLAVFDYPKEELRLYPTGSSAAMQAECGQSIIPVTLEGGVVLSSVDTDRGTFKFVWDTGSSWNMLRPTALGEKPADMVPGQRPPSFSTSKLVLGGRDFGAASFPLIQFSAPDADGFLGTPFFKSKVTCLDVTRGVAGIR